MYKSADLILKQWIFQVLYSCAISLAIQLPDTCISTGTSPPPHTSNMIKSEVHLLNCDSKRYHKVWHNTIMISFVWTEQRHWSFKINEYINHTNLYTAWIKPAPFFIADESFVLLGFFSLHLDQSHPVDNILSCKSAQAKSGSGSLQVSLPISTPGVNSK